MGFVSRKRKLPSSCKQISVFCINVDTTRNALASHRGLMNVSFEPESRLLVSGKLNFTCFFSSSKNNQYYR